MSFPWFSIERGFLTAKGRGSGNSVKEKGLPMDDGLDVGNGGEASGSITSNIKNSPSPPDMHFFKFGSKEGMEAILESGPWLIRNVPLVLKKWTPNANIMKEDVCNIHVWVKFHDVPITAFTEYGLSAIATKLGSPLMLDSYTAAMCIDSWGRASYARAMIELKPYVDLRVTIVVIVPKFSDDCPKKIVLDISKNSKMSRQPARGPPVGLKRKYTFVYRPVSTKKRKRLMGIQRKRGGNQTPSTNATSVVAKINKLERQMLDGNFFLLVDEHGKLLEMKVTNEASASNPSTYMRDQLVQSDEDEVELPDDETSRYMSSTGRGGLCEDDLDFYDGYEARVYDLPEQMQTFCDQFDIRLRSRVKK
ncbi:RNA-directed DNA polymerase, eukaryota [Tanacetum coccineum]